MYINIFVATVQCLITVFKRNVPRESGTNISDVRKGNHMKRVSKKELTKTTYQNLIISKLYHFYKEWCTSNGDTQQELTESSFGHFQVKEE